MSSLALPAARPLTLRWPRAAAVLPGLLAAIAAAAACLHPSLDSDLGWHLRTGQLILATHQVPRTDPFSHTRLGAPWVDNEWLWESGVAALHALAGPLALIAANALLGSLAIGLIYLTLRRRAVPVLLSAAGSCLALINLVPYADVRPGMAGVLCSAAFVLVLDQYRRSGNWPWLLALLPIEALWANSHGSYVLGLVLCGIYAVASLWERREWRRLQTWAALCAGLLTVTLLNPIGFDLLKFTVGASRLTFNREFVQAWMAPNFHQPGSLPLLITLLLSLALPLFRPASRLPKTEGLLLVVCTLATLQSQEFLPLYAVVAAPLVAQMLQSDSWMPASWQPSPLQTAALLLSGAVLMLVPLNTLAPDRYQQTIEKTFPARAVDYIEQHQLPGPMWNDFNWGGYLLTALPRLPVLVDSRTEMYGDEFLHEYMDAATGRLPPQQALDRYAVKLVLLEPRSTLATELRGSPVWQQVYQDELAVVFTRSGN